MTQPLRHLRSAHPTIGLPLLILSLLGLLACSRSSPPSPDIPTVHFVGKRLKLCEEGGQRLPCYRPGDPISLWLEPAPATPGHCSLFPGGSVDVKLEPPGRDPLLLGRFPLLAPFLTEVQPGYVVEALSSPANADAPEPLKLSDASGLWHLQLEWTCTGTDAGRATSRHPFVNRSLPPTIATLADTLNERLSGLSVCDKARAFLGELRTQTDLEGRLLLLRNLVPAWMRAGQRACFDLDLDAIVAEWRELARLTGIPTDELLAINNAAEAAQARGDLSAALFHRQEADALADRWDFQPQRARGAYHRAILLNELGRPIEALETSIQARLEAARAADRQKQQEALLLELELLQAVGHPVRAQQRFQTMLEAEFEKAEAQNTVAWLALRGVELGSVRPEDRPAMLALIEKNLQQSLKELLDEGRESAAHVRANLVFLELFRKNLEQARTLLRTAAAEASPADTALQLFLLRMEGQLALDSGQYEEALSAFVRLEQRAEALEPPGVEYAGQGAFGQGEVRLRQGRFESAIDHFERALDWIEEDEAARSPLYRATSLASRAPWEAGAVEALLKLQTPSAPLQALDVAERGTWARRQTLQHASRSESLPREVQQEVRSLQAELETLDLQMIPLQKLKNTGVSLSGAQQERLTLLQTQRLSSWSRLQLKLALPGQGSPPPLNLAALQERLPIDARALRLVSYPEQLVIWELSATGMHVRVEPWPRATLEDSVSRFEASCRAGTPDLALGSELARVLLGQTWGEAPPARLFVLTEAPLRSLPWHALRIGEGWLLERTAVTLVPSLFFPPTPENGAPPEETSPPGVLIVADPSHDLPLARQEGQALASLLAGAEVLERDAATRETLLERLPRVGRLHFAGHGSLDPDQPHLSYLQMARHKRVTLMDLYGLRLPRSLVFLNACFGSQVAGVGGGTLGLSDAFSAAGARSVISSLWKTPDQEGRQVALEFYRVCAETASARAPSVVLAEVLRKLATGEGGGGRVSPAVWSAYVGLETDFQIVGCQPAASR